MPFQIRKSLTIGLGGTGHDAVLHAKRRCIEMYGEVPPTTRFYVIDTLPSKPLEIDGGPLELASSEFQQLGVTNPETVIRESQEIQAWFPDSVQKRAVTQGAGQVRARGRLAAYANASQIHRTVRELVDSIGNWDVNRLTRENPKFEPYGDGRQILVNVVASLAGGTGSGIFLDIALVLRQCLRDGDIMTAYLLLPDVFTGRGGTSHVQANAYAALRELSYFMDLDTGHQESFDFGGEKIKEDRPFDVVYLVNNKSKDRTSYSEVDELTEFLGRGIFMLMGPTGHVAGDIWDNLRTYVTQQNYWHGKSAIFSSFGLHELVYDPVPFIHRYTRLTALELTRTLRDGQTPDTDDAVGDFVQRNELGTDEVVRDLVKHDNPPLFEIIEPFSKASVQRMLDDAPHYLVAARNDSQRKSTEYYGNKLAPTTDALERFVHGRIASTGGVACCKRFLQTLKTRMVSYRDTMSAAASRQSKIDEETRNLEQRTAEADRLRFARRTTWRDLEREIKESVVNQARWHGEQIRDAEAVRLYSKLVERIDEQLKLMEQWERHAEAIVGELEHDLDQSMPRPLARPYVTVFEPPAAEPPPPNVQELVRWLQKQGQTISDFFALSARDSTTMLLNYAKSQRRVQDAEKETIEGLLDKLKKRAEDECIGHVQGLADKSSPLWSYDRGYVTGDRDTHMFYLIGTQSVGSSVLDDVGVKRNLSNAGDRIRIGTGDAKRITCLKIEAGIPAYIIDGMDGYRRCFQNSNAPFPYHTSARYDELSDLFPSSDDEINQKWWALAQAAPFNLIRSEGSYYYFHPHGETVADPVLLGSGRLNALKGFLGNGGVPAEAARRIEQTVREQGEQRVRDSLDGWIREATNALDQERNMKPELRDLKQMEIEEVTRYVAELDQNP